MALDFFRAAGSPSSASLEQFMLLTSAKVLSPYSAVALKPATPISRRPNRQQAEPQEAIGFKTHD
jgi:hypothetical protein